MPSKDVWRKDLADFQKIQVYRSFCTQGAVHEFPLPRIRRRSTGKEKCKRGGRNRKQVKALKLCNRFGEISAGLEETGEAVLISKGRKIRAVLITPEPFARRFLGCQREESKRRIWAAIASLRGARAGEKESLAVLRKLRGYEA